MSVILVMEMPVEKGEFSSCRGDTWGIGVSVLLVKEMPGEQG